jgi:hypothetical protein
MIGRATMFGQVPAARVNSSITAMPSPRPTKAHTMVPKRALIVTS